jgi:hypothetical protein
MLLLTFSSLICTDLFPIILVEGIIAVAAPKHPGGLTGDKKEQGVAENNASVREIIAEELQKAADEYFAGEDLTPEQRFAKFLETEEGRDLRARFEALPQRVTKSFVNSAYKPIEDAAAEIRKQEPDLTKEQAVAEVIERRPDLVEAYRRRERRV